MYLKPTAYVPEGLGTDSALRPPNTTTVNRFAPKDPRPSGRDKFSPTICRTHAVQLNRSNGFVRLERLGLKNKIPVVSRMERIILVV